MRRIAFVAVVALLVGCSNEPTAPGTDDQVTAFATQAEGTVLTAAGGYDADLYELRLFHGLPDDIKLTPEQEAKIKALVDAYKKATRADQQAFEAVLRDAKAAVKAHKSADDVKAILDKGAPIAGRLAKAAEDLKTAIDGVLTAAQRDWLASHAPKNCKKGSFPPLTDAQKTQMKAFEAAFETANKADLEAVRKGLDAIKAAVKAGASASDIQKILDGIKTPLDHLTTARKTLHDQLESVLTPEQKASGCIPLG